MNKVTVSEKIPEDFCRRVVACIETALNDDVKRYLDEFQPDTTNGLPHQVYDFINTNLKKNFKLDNMRIIQINRYGWKGRVVLDDANKLAFTIMRESRLYNLKKEHRSTPHYLQTFACILNGDLEGNSKQLTLSCIDLHSFTEEELLEDFDRLCGDSINLSDGYRHCLIVFETEKGELFDIKVFVLDKDLDVVEECSLKQFIKPDYSVLINKESNTGNTFTREKAPNVIPLPLKGKSLVKLKSKEKENNE